MASFARIPSVLQGVDEEGDGALLATPEPINRFPDFVRHIVIRLKVLCPTMGKKRISQTLCSAVVRPTTRLHRSHPKIFQLKLLLEKRDLRVSLFKRGPQPRRDASLLGASTSSRQSQLSEGDDVENAGPYVAGPVPGKRDSWCVPPDGFRTRDGLTCNRDGGYVVRQHTTEIVGLAPGVASAATERQLSG